MTGHTGGIPGDLCWCPAADGAGHYWHPQVCPRVPVPEPPP